MAAMGLHQQGKLLEAKAIYKSLLKLNPKHADSLHLLGLIASQLGESERAVEFISRAIVISPNICSDA